MIRYFIAAVFLLSLCSCNSGGGSGPIDRIKDEALASKPPRLPDSFTFAGEDYFYDMDQTGAVISR